MRCVHHGNAYFLLNLVWISRCRLLRLLRLLFLRWFRISLLLKNLLRPPFSRLFAVACEFTWILLWLSGKNMGEAARLRCFVTPWMSIIAAQAIEPDTKNARRTWLMLLVMQLLTATITVGRVSGFLEFAASQ